MPYFIDVFHGFYQTPIVPTFIDIVPFLINIVPTNNSFLFCLPVADSILMPIPGHHSGQPYKAVNANRVRDPLNNKNKDCRVRN